MLGVESCNWFTKTPASPHNIGLNSVADKNDNSKSLTPKGQLQRNPVE